MALKHNSSTLAVYLQNFQNLTPYDFEDMVCEMFKLKGWANVYVTSRANDKGRDVIGTDLTGNKVYIEVKKHKSNIGRPVIQKLHSIMVNDNISRGIVVATAGFTPDAINYAKNLKNSEMQLMDGQEFLANCHYLIKGGVRPNSQCFPVDLVEMKNLGSKILNISIFSYPKPPSSFIQRSTFLTFYYNPYYLINFSVNQVFQNKSGSWVYHLIRRNEFIQLDTGGNFSIFNQNPISHTSDLEDIENYLQDNNQNVKKRKLNYKMSINDMKKVIQRATTTTQSYLGRNGQLYNKKCQPSLNKITIINENLYWMLSVDLHLYLQNLMEIDIILEITTQRR